MIEWTTLRRAASVCTVTTSWNRWLGAATTAEASENGSSTEIVTRKQNSRRVMQPYVNDAFCNAILWNAWTQKKGTEAKEEMGDARQCTERPMR